MPHRMQEPGTAAKPLRRSLFQRNRFVLHMSLGALFVGAGLLLLVSTSRWWLPSGPGIGTAAGQNVSLSVVVARTGLTLPRNATLVYYWEDSREPKTGPRTDCSHWIAFAPIAIDFPPAGAVVIETIPEDELRKIGSMLLEQVGGIPAVEVLQAKRARWSIGPNTYNGMWMRSKTGHYLFVDSEDENW